MQSGSLSSHFRDSFSNSFAVINGVWASGLQSRFQVNPEGFGSPRYPVTAGSSATSTIAERPPRAIPAELHRNPMEYCYLVYEF